MERVVRLNRLWSWLPAFRAVAETEHVHQAAALLRLTPSTLSRAVHLVEEDVGRPLFRRAGRSLELTDAGRVLADALREAMRRLDDALTTIAGDAVPGPLRVACDEAAALAVVLAAAQALRAEDADASRDAAMHDAAGEPRLSPPSSDVAADLLRGTIDLAFVREATPHAELAVERVGTLGWSVYCAPSHPLAGLAVTREALATQPFVDGGAPWPPELPRAIAMHVPGPALAAAACAAGALLAFLPDDAAPALVPLRAPDGRRVVTVATPLYAVRRRLLDARDPTRALVAAVRARLGDVEQPVANFEMDWRAANA